MLGIAWSSASTSEASRPATPAHRPAVLPIQDRNRHRYRRGPPPRAPSRRGDHMTFGFPRARQQRNSRARRSRPAVEVLEDRTVPTLLGQQLFPGDNPWNQKITSAPVAANSATIINNIISLQ